MNKQIATSILLLVVIIPAPMGAQQDTHGYVAEYYLLGMLDEYMGRKIETGFVEYFYREEEETAEQFEFYLNKLAADHNIEPAQRGPGANGGIEYQSEKIAELLNSYYLTGNECEQEFHFLAFKALEWNEEVMKSFLAGAKARYYRDGRFKFANNLRKAQLIRSILLMYFECDTVTISMTGTIPSTVTLEFTHISELDEIFGDKK